MPASFVQSEPTVITVGADIVRNAVRNTYVAHPSGVVFPLLFVTMRPGDWPPAKISQTANKWANVWNTNAAAPGVEDIVIVQHVTAAGNLDDVASVTVGSTSGLSTSVLDVKRVDWQPADFQVLTIRERERLDEIENANPPTVGIGPGGGIEG